MVCLKNPDSLIILSSIQLHFFLIDIGEIKEIEMSIYCSCSLVFCLNLFRHFEITKQKQNKEMKEEMKEKGRKENRVFNDMCQSFINEFLYFKEQAGSSQDCRAAGREGQSSLQRTLVTIHIESLPQSSCSQTSEHKLPVTKLLS